MIARTPPCRPAARLLGTCRFARFGGHGVAISGSSGGGRQVCRFGVGDGAPLGVAQWNATTVPNWSTLEDEFAQLRQDGIFISVAAAAFAAPAPPR